VEQGCNQITCAQNALCYNNASTGAGICYCPVGYQSVVSNGKLQSCSNAVAMMEVQLTTANTWHAAYATRGSVQFKSMSLNLISWMITVLNNNGQSGRYLSVVLVDFRNEAGKLHARLVIYWPQNTNVNAQSAEIGGYIQSGIKNGVTNSDYQLTTGASYYITGLHN